MKGKKIDIKDITNSPYFVAVLLVLVIALVITGIVFIILDITKTKDKIVETREAYQLNLQEIAVLEELRAQSEKAEQQLEIYKGILPDGLGDVYILQEDVIKTCKNFGLEVTSIEVTQAPAQTQETTFVFNVNGSFSGIYEYMKYVSNLEQVHRIDALSLAQGDAKEGGYTATISLAILSQNGADGIVSAVVDEVVNAVTEPVS